MSEFHNLVAEAVDSMAEDCPATMVWSGVNYTGVASPILSLREMELGGSMQPWETRFVATASQFATFPDPATKEEYVVMNGVRFRMVSVSRINGGSVVDIRLKRI